MRRREQVYHTQREAMVILANKRRQGDYRIICDDNGWWRVVENDDCDGDCPATCLLHPRCPKYPVQS